MKIVNSGDIAQFIAHTFDPGVDYTAGKYVWYNGELYRFNTAHSAGAWTGTDASQYTATDEYSLIQSNLTTLNAFAANVATVAETKAFLGIT